MPYADPKARRDYAREYYREYYKKNKDKYRRWGLRHYAKHAETIREKAREYAREHAETRHAYNLEYRRTNPRYKEKREWYKRVIRAHAIIEPCVDCGVTSTKSDKHYHHRDPKGDIVRVSAMSGYRWTRIFDEMDKCDILCEPCHAKRHVQMKKNAA